MVYFYNKCSQFDGAVTYTVRCLSLIMNISIEAVGESELEGLSENDLLLCYQDTDSSPSTESLCREVVILNSGLLFGDNYKKKDSMPAEPFISEKFVSLYRSKGHISDNGKVIPYDIIADAFFMLSRYEEYASVNQVKRDKFGRFTARNSAAVRYGFLSRPVVDEWAFYLKEIIEKSGCSFERMVSGRRAKLLVTHDVDSIRKYKDMMTVFEALQSGTFQIRNLTRRGDVYHNISALAKWENRHGIRADYYFIPEYGENNADYHITDRSLLKEIRLMKHLGHEMGYHGGFDTSEDSVQTECEMCRLRQAFGSEMPVTGSRQHFLKNRFPDTFLALEKAGICYDTTLAFPDMEGFRCGTCHPYPLYDVLSGRELAVWEIPLLFMDVTLKEYRRYSPATVKRKFGEYYKIVRKYEGVLTILWHNNRFAEEEWAKYNRIYFSYAVFLQKQFESMTGREILEEYKSEKRYRDG